jgi:hypothetical protein
MEGAFRERARPPLPGRMIGRGDPDRPDSVKWKPGAARLAAGSQCTASAGATQEQVNASEVQP